MTSRIRWFAGIAVVAVLLIVPAPAQTQLPRDWWLLDEIEILPAAVATRDLHRLANLTNGMQIVIKGGSPASLGFARLPQGKTADDPRSVGRNVRIRRLVDDASFESPKDTGPSVLLNEPVALYFEGPGFLIYRKDSGGIGLEWQRESHFNPLRKDRDVYQWQFEIPRDQRSRPLMTKEHVALRNTVRSAHLVLDKSRNRLAWHRP